jgi:uncharacterized coiled-coil DUF342 family protein
MGTSAIIEVLDTKRRLTDLRRWQMHARTPGEFARVKAWADAVQARLQELLRERESLRRDLGQALLDLAEAMETNQRLRDEIDWLRDELEPRAVLVRRRPSNPAA